MIHQNNISGLLLLISLIVAAAGCSPTKKTANLQLSAAAAFDAGNYELALAEYETLASIWNETNAREENPYLDKAGHAAFEMGDTEKAVGYFAESMFYGTASISTYTKLIAHYREAANFSRELMTIEGLTEAYPESPVTQQYQQRLFEMYAEAEQWQEAEAQWKNIGGEKDISLLEHFFEVNRQLDNRERADSLANVIIAADPNNAAALEWRATQYFNRAEQRYNAEMSAYDQNRTRRQYAQLLEGLEIANKDYRSARDIFERLYQKSPEKRYAMYLYNIYSRFEDSQKANYYRSRM